MKFLLIAEDRDNRKRTSFYKWWEVLLLALVIVLVLSILLPKKLLPTILVNKRPSKAAVGYLRAFHAKQPSNTNLKLTLVEHEIALGNLERAKRYINDIKKSNDPLPPELANELYWVDYLIIRYKANKARRNTPTRLLYLQRMRQMQEKLATLPIHTDELRTIANDSIGLGRPELALQIYDTLLARGQLVLPVDLAHGALVAIQNNKPLDAAKFYWIAYEKAKNLEDKRTYALKAMHAYWAANEIERALIVAEKLPANIVNTPSTLLFLSQMALANSKLELAEAYVKRSIGLSEKTDDKDLARQLRKIPHNNEGFKTFYRLLLFQSKIDAAFEVAKYASSKRPKDLFWRKELAQTATWSGDFDLGMKEWIYLVKHDPRVKVFNEAVFTVSQLGFNTVAVDMLNTYLKKHPNDPQAILQLAYAQNRIGQPQLALQNLTNLRHIRPSREVDEMAAQIYEDTMAYDRALKLWQQIDKTYGPNVKSVMAQASIHYIRGQFQEAIDVLKTAIPVAKSENLKFWDTLGDLAWLLNDRALVIESYSKSLDNKSHLSTVIELTKLETPREALKLAVQGWTQFKDPNFFNQHDVYSNDVEG